MLTTDKFNIKTLLEKIKCGEIQLPDFQRDWVWKDKQIQSLLESVIRGFPINSILLLECDTNNIKFSHRMIHSLEESDIVPQYLILDGQQRLTSLFGALLSDKPVSFSRNKKKFFYYVDMTKAIESVKNSADVEDMILSVPEDKIVKLGKEQLDLSTPDKEYAAGMFPLNKLINFFSWLSGYQQVTGNINHADEFYREVIQKVTEYQIICIKLDKNTPLEAVCKIFEKVNISGVVLTVFDLLTAILASYKADGKVINLRDDWKNIHDNIFGKTNLDILRDIDGTDFISALTLFVSYKNFRYGKACPIGCKRENILKLEPTDYLQYRDEVAQGFIDAGKFLEEEGITKAKYLPYKPQLIPLSALFAALKIFAQNTAASRNKIRQWYWSGVFSEAYRDGHLARFTRDIVQVMKWIENDEEPEIIRNAQIVAAALIRVKGVQSAAFKGIVSIIFRNNATDFRLGKVMMISANHNENIDVHHIFPKQYCADNGLPVDIYDSILNKTPISSDTNKIIGRKSPSVYIKDFEALGNTPQQINDSFASHFIDADLCRANDFDAFAADRAKKILDAIELIINRKVSGRDSQEIIKLFGKPL